MIKLTFALVRRPELTREQFQDYWLGVHAPLVASVRDALRIRRYVQLHSLPLEASAALRDVRGGLRASTLRRSRSRAWFCAVAVGSRC